METPKLLFIKSTKLKPIFFVGASLLFLLGGCAFTPEKSDLYGMKMRSESVVKDLADSASEDDFTSDNVDKRIFACANFSYAPFSRGDISVVYVRITNQSDKPISVKRLFTKLSFVLYDGRRLEAEPRSALYPTTDLLKPGKSTTLRVRVGHLHVRKDQIQTLVCDLDMGSTKIVLLPTQ